MRKYLYLILLLVPLKLSGQQDNLPVAGVSDRRADIWGFKNARIVVDYQTTLENADILISEGRIQAVGQKLTFPEGTTIIDLTGKTVYPSLLDVYAGNYGIKTQTQPADANPYAAFITQMQTGRQSTPATPEPRVADYWNDGINASYDVSTEFIPDTRTAGEYRQAGFGAVVTFRADGIARGTSALVTTGEGRANNVLLRNKDHCKLLVCQISVC